MSELFFTKELTCPSERLISKATHNIRSYVERNDNYWEFEEDLAELDSNVKEVNPNKDKKGSPKKFSFYNFCFDLTVFAISLEFQRSKEETSANFSNKT